MTPATLSLPNPARRKTSAAILGIGSAAPPGIPQTNVMQLAADMACQTPRQRQWLQRVFLHSGIDTRSSVLAPDGRSESLAAFYPPPTTPSDRGPTTAQRMERYAACAPLLAADAATRALADSNAPADTITHLITVSCTGFYAPGLDVALIRALDLSPSVHRRHIGFMGCHASFNALAAARDAVLADPAARVLVCSVELCSLHFAYGWDPGKLIANALFADGAAAVVIGRSDTPQSSHDFWHLQDTASLLIPGSLEAMTWRIGDHGFEMTLAPEVPDLIAQHLGPWCESWLARRGLTVADIASWAIHPGGPKILSAVAAALGLNDSALHYSRHILARHGNMSSATVLFILQRMAESHAPGPCVAIGLGPGLMAEGMLLDSAG